MKKAMNQSTLTMILNGISILALIFMGFALFSNSHIRTLLNSANEERFNLTYNANRFMNGSAYLTNEVRAFAATGIQEHYDNYWKEVNELKNRDLGVAAMQEIGITEDEQHMIDDMFALSNELVPLEEKAMNQVTAGDRESAINYVNGTDYNSAIAQISALKEQFLTALDTRTKARLDDLNGQAAFIRVVMSATLFLIAIIQLMIMFVTNKRVMRPVVAVRDQMGEISNGNLSAAFSLEPDTSEIGMLVASIHETKQELKKYIQDIDHTLSQMAQGSMDLSIGNDYRGEFLPIQNAMRQILDSLNEALRSISQTAQEVSEESQRVAAGAQTLSEGAVQQASTVEELSAGIQDISGQVSRTSEDAAEARKFAAEAGEQLKMCSTKMKELTSAIADIAASSKTYRHDNLTRKKCPSCGKLMLEVNHKNGRMLVCQDRACGYRKTLARITNARCPQCHKKMELSGEGENQRFTCVCGYREKLSAFEKRKKESGGGVSKKDMSKYMHKIKKEADAPLNHAFADAFAKLNL